MSNNPGAIARVLRAQSTQKTTHDELVRALGTILKPGDSTRWTTIRRALSLAGHHKARSHAIAFALCEAFPDSHLSREGERQRGNRIVVGVEMAVDLQQMRRELADKWEAILTSEGMPADLSPIATEYVTPIATDGGPSTRLGKLVNAVHARREWAGHYFGKATDYLWSTDWEQFNPSHRAIWERHCEGASRDEISRELGLTDSVVRRRLDFHRARAGLVHN